MTYHLDHITDHEFELLCADLMRAEFGQRAEVFSPGRDRGIDIRILADAPGSELDVSIIGQCKKWRPDRYDALVAELSKVELPKIEALGVQRYILFTTVTLNPDRKENIRAALAPYIVSESDVLGPEDIQSLLRQHEDVVRRHPKLWLTGTEVLDAIVRAATVFRSESVAERLREQLILWAPNSSFDDARDLLRNQRTCIISGPPGIGKSMLADILVANYVSEGYQPVVISEDIDEAEGSWRSETPQIFYYDDFLGRISLGELALRKNEDSRLVQFVDRIQHSANKLLVLTTREYILREASFRFERLESSWIEPKRFVLALENYSRIVRAKILYNHLYFAGLPAQLRSALLEEKTYLKVIDHRRYNPRLLRQLIDQAVLDDPSPEEFRAEFLNSLQNPDSVWARVFATLSRPCRTILLVMGSLPRSVRLGDLQLAAEACGGEAMGDPLVFNGALRTLEETFVAIDKDPRRADDERIVRFRDPSVADFVWAELQRDQVSTKRMLAGAVFYEQCVVFAKGRTHLDLGRPVLDDTQFILDRATELIGADPLKSTSDFVWMNRKDHEVRLRQIVEIAGSKQGLDMSALSEAFGRTSERLRRGRFLSSSVIDLLRAARDVASIRSIYVPLLREAALAIGFGIETLDDAESFHDLHSLDPDIVEAALGDELGRVFESGKDALTREFYSLTSDQEDADADSVYQAAEKFKLCGSFFGFDGSEAHDRLEEFARELPHSDDPDDDERAHTHDSSDGSDHAIDLMFDGLRSNE